MLQDSRQWHFDYPRLACDAGFVFDRHNSHNIEKNKINQIDVDRIIKERDVVTVERYIPAVVQFTLEPDQAELLDSRFVNTFRLSQLSLEYLLFCKTYLDNTVVLLKKELGIFKQENKELKEFVEELKDHIALLMRKAKEQQQSVHKCEECNKMFSTDEFLNAHKLRRHIHLTNQSEPESSKLHLEIKELKGRLNTAEKLLQDQNRPTHGREDSKIDELQGNFQKLKNQVESELKQLERQQNFEEKCEKWFGLLTLQNMKEDNTKKVESMPVEVRERRESTTQTESLIIKQPEIDKSLDHNNQNQIEEFQEVIESKVSSSLQKIENQMESFWDKLNEIEAAKISNDTKIEPEIVQNPPLSPPKIKPRTRYTATNTNSRTREVVKSPTRQVVREYPKSRNNVINREVNPAVRESSSTSESSSSESESVKSADNMPPPAVQKTLVVANRSRPISAVKKTKPAKKDQIPNDLIKEKVENNLMERLQELGISPDWDGLPARSFTRALEIVNHQANLMKKTHPDFLNISSKIESRVSELLKENESVSSHKNKNIRRTTKPRKIIPKTSLQNKTQVEIKNRKMYETDSEESESLKGLKASKVIHQAAAPYSAVIQELKNSTLAKLDSELLLSSDLEKSQEDQTKGVLKNYPSVGSLTKKKVIFNLDDEGANKSSKIAKEISGSTTSLASSVLDGTPRNNKSVKNKNEENKDIEDLSDFDFSEI